MRSSAKKTSVKARRPRASEDTLDLDRLLTVLVAVKNKMDLAVNISIGSSAQIALFVAPVLVIASFFIGEGPMPLVFNGFELGAVLLAVFVANHVTSDGESNWF